MAITLTTSYQLLAETNLGSFGYGTLYLREYGKYDSQSIGNNTTTYTLKLAIYCAGSYCYSGNCYAYISGTCVQNNTGLTFPTNGEITLGTKTSTVAHNSDGTRYVEEGGSFSCYAGTNGNVDAGFDLPTIPRASTIACTTANIGETAIITIDRKANTFTHTITYTFGTLSGTIVTKTTNTTLSWTIPTTFYAQIPNNKTGVGTLKCITFDSSGNTVGSATSISFTVTVNTENNKPTVTISAVDTGLTLPTGVTTTSLTGSDKKLINNWSSVKVTATATAKNSATIKSTTTKCGDGQSSTSLTPTFTKVHSKDFSVTATDSRGISNSASTSDLTLVAYTEIQTTEIILKRISQTSGTIQLSLTGNYFNGSFGSVTNDITLKYRYKENGGTWSSYTTLSLTKSSGTFSYSNDELLTGLDYQTAYNFELVLTDKVNVYTIPITISKGVPVYDYGENDFRVNVDFNFKGALLTGIKTLTNAGSAGWSDITDAQKYLIDKAFMAYWNGRYNDTGGSNLTYCKDGTIQAKPTTLYENTTGTTETVTLSQSVANFNYIEIFYRRNANLEVWSNHFYTSTRVDTPDGKIASLSVSYPAETTTTQISTKLVLISGTSITVQRECYANIVQDSSGQAGTQTQIFITKVVGYK